MKSIRSLKPIKTFLSGLIQSIKERRKIMSTVTVTKVGQTRSGKPCVYFDGKLDYIDAYYLGSKTEMPPEGAVIEAVTASSDFKGKTYWYLNSWKLANGALQPKAPVQGQQTTQTAGWRIDPSDLCRFASNVVGQALLAGLIKTPNDVAPWVHAAYKAGESLKSGDPKPFNDEPGF
jgi:hypothetical protein